MPIQESVAQSVEQRTFNPWVEGSSPSALTPKKTWEARFPLGNRAFCGTTLRRRDLLPASIFPPTFVRKITPRAVDCGLIPEKNSAIQSLKAPQPDRTCQAILPPLGPPILRTNARIGRALT